MKIDKNFNGGQIAYYSPSLEDGEILMVKILDIDTLIIKDKENNQQNKDTLFLVINHDTIYSDNLLSDRYVEKHKFTASVPQLFHKKMDAINALINKKEEKINTLQAKLKAKEKIALTLKSVKTEDKEIVKAKTKTEQFYGVELEVIEIFNMDYYTFSTYNINSLWNEEDIDDLLSFNEPLIFIAKIKEAVKQSDYNIRYTMITNKGFGTSYNKQTHFTYSESFYAQGHRIYEDFNSAMIGLKSYINESIINTKNETKNLKSDIDILRNIQSDNNIY